MVEQRPRATVALAALAATPLFAGGFTPFTWMATGCAIATAAATLPANRVGGVANNGLSRPRTLVFLIALALAAIGLALVQLVPLPPALAAAIAPGATALDRELGATGAWRPLSQDPGATREAALALLIGALLVVTTTAVAADRAARRWIYLAVVSAAAIVAALGVVEAFAGRPLIRTGLPDHARPFGPFANRNHAASLLLLGLPCAAGLSRDFERDGRARASGALLVGAGLFVLALVLNGSRGGLLAAFVLVAAVAWRARGRVGWRIAGAVAIALAIALPGAAWARRHELTTVSERLTLARDALSMGLDSPVAGIGLGAFAAAYPPRQTVPLDLRFRHVESEPVELFVEGGVPLLVIAIAAAALLARACVRVSAQRGIARGNVRGNALGNSSADAGAALGVLAVIAHCCCDFPLRVPGVVLPLLLLASGVLACESKVMTKAEPVT